MQRTINTRKVVEAYEADDMKKKPHVDTEQLNHMEELELDEPKYSIGVFFYNDGDKTVEIVGYDKESHEEIGRLLCRNVDDINTFMSGAFSLFHEYGGKADQRIICSF